MANTCEAFTVHGNQPITGFQSTILVSRSGDFDATNHEQVTSWRFAGHDGDTQLAVGSFLYANVELNKPMRSRVCVFWC